MEFNLIVRLTWQPAAGEEQARGRQLAERPAGGGDSREPSARPGRDRDSQESGARPGGDREIYLRFMS